MILRIFNCILLFCFFSLCFTRSHGNTCIAYRTRQFYDLLPTSVDVPGYRKHGPEIYQRHLLTSEYPQEDEMNLTDQCPSFLLDGTDPIKPSLFKEKSDKGNVTESKNESTEQPPIATFEEWTKQKLEQEKRKIQIVNVVNGAENGGEHTVQQQPTVGDKKTNSVLSNSDGQKKEEPPKSTQLVDILPIGASKRNYGSKECGAKVIAANDETENRGAILNDKEKDEYMRNPCEKVQEKFLIIELCETIQPTSVELANFELFSSSVKEFRILASPRYPTVEWTNLGEFVAQDTREVQSFDIPSHNTYTKFLRLELISHYGKEHFCTLSAFRVYGMSISDEIDLVEAEGSSQFHQIPIVEEVKNVETNEPQKTETTEEIQKTEEMHQMEPIVEPVVAQEIIVPIDDIPEEPSIIQQNQITASNAVSWEIEDCQKCTGGQQSATTWLCYVFSPRICSEARIKKIRARTVFIRSAGQVKFLKSILKPLPMCSKDSAPPPDLVQNLRQKGEPSKAEQNQEGVNDMKIQQKIVKPQERPPSIPLPAGPTSHKESVFLKLNKRLSALELNISLSSEYLSELSRRYVAQIEESKKEQEKNMHITEKAIEKETKMLRKQFSDQLQNMKEEIKLISKRMEALSALSSTMPAWTGPQTEDSQKNTRDLAIRTTCSAGNKNCNRGDFDNVYLDGSDGLWTTNQLLVILAAMQLSTIVVIFAIFYFWRKESPTKERVVLISSDFDVREMIKEEIKKEIESEKVSSEKSGKSENPTNISIPIISTVPNNTTAVSKRKKKKKKNNQGLTVAEKWDTASISSAFSSMSNQINDQDSASSTISEITKKGSVTSGDSCFVSDGTECNSSSQGIPSTNPCAIST